MGCSKNNFKREVFSLKCLPQETRKISDEQSKITPQGTRKRTNKAQSKRKEKKIRAETNEIENKNIIEKIIETKRWFFDKMKLTNL